MTKNPHVAGTFETVDGEPYFQRVAWDRPDRPLDNEDLLVRAVCSCGWKGEPQPWQGAARTLHAHMEKGKETPHV